MRTAPVLRRLARCAQPLLLLLLFKSDPPTGGGAFDFPPPQWGGLGLNSSNRGCVCLGSEVAPLSGRLKKKHQMIPTRDGRAGAVKKTIE